jgi:hypothetical protein
MALQDIRKQAHDLHGPHRFRGPQKASFSDVGSWKSNAGFNKSDSGSSRPFDLFGGRFRYLTCWVFSGCFWVFSSGGASGGVGVGCCVMCGSFDISGGRFSNLPGVQVLAMKTICD